MSVHTTELREPGCLGYNLSWGGSITRIVQRIHSQVGRGHVRGCVQFESAT
ncbi:UNVERIFIED_CONTAM: hypothetical protein FKN15_066991 [Acipenser sinensis]